MVEKRRRNLPGTIYTRNDRHWWKVKLPGESEYSFIALKPPGARYATKDRDVAELIAGNILAEHERKQRINPGDYDGTVDSLLNHYRVYALAYYGEKGAREAENDVAMLRVMYGGTLAEDFTSLDLKRVIEALVDSDLSRRTVNGRIGRIKRVYKWAAGAMLVSMAARDNLLLVENLRKGRSILRVDDPTQTIKPRQTRRPKPVPREVVESTLPYLSSIVAAMVELQGITGMRSTEICIMRPCDIDRSGEVWIYRPTKFKNEWREDFEEKEICLGPRAQEVIRPYLFRDTQEFLFTPAESDAEHRKRRHEKRKTPLTYGNRPGTNNRGIKAFRECFDAATYRRAVTRAVDAANAARAQGAEKIPQWHPHQLRHAATTAIRKKLGKEAAQALIGHSDKAMTEHYSREATLSLARDAAGKVG